MAATGYKDNSEKHKLTTFLKSNVKLTVLEGLVGGPANVQQIHVVQREAPENRYLRNRKYGTGQTHMKESSVVPVFIDIQQITNFAPRILNNLHDREAHDEGESAHGRECDAVLEDVPRHHEVVRLVLLARLLVDEGGREQVLLVHLIENNNYMHMLMISDVHTTEYIDTSGGNTLSITDRKHVGHIVLSKCTHLADEHVEDDGGSVVEEGRVGEEEQHEVLVVLFTHTLVQPVDGCNRDQTVNVCEKTYVFCRSIEKLFRDNTT